MAIGNVELVHECFPKNLSMGPERIKKDKETDEREKERHKYGQKQSEHEKKSPDRLAHPYQNITIINIIYFIWNGKKYNEIQLTKKQNVLEQWKN